MDSGTGAKDVMQRSPEAGSSPPGKQLLDEPEIVTIDTGYRKCLYNVACQSDEIIWTNGDDKDPTKTLKIIYQRQLRIQVGTKSGAQPSDIAMTKSGDLVYTDENDRTVNIVRNMKKENLQKHPEEASPDIMEVIKTKRRPVSVCSASSDDLLVITKDDANKPSEVVRYFGNSDFKESKTIRFYKKGEDEKKLFINIFNLLNITENRNLDICVTDSGAKEVVVVNQDGKKRFSYAGHTPDHPNPMKKPFNPRGITTDSQSHILTADHDNGCVDIIHQDGQFLSSIKCGLSFPWGLCTGTDDNLFVAQWEKKQVQMIKYLN